MTAGKGFIGLAAMIFGNWNPGGAYLGALIFGFFNSWQEKLSILQVGVPPELLGMVPYIATMIVLAGFIGRARMPAADGTPYEKTVMYQTRPRFELVYRSRFRLL